MKYRRSTEKGGTYFFTLVTYQRQPILTIAGNIERFLDETDWNNHRDYIHFNPVKHGLVVAASEWPYSSFKKFVEKGYYSSDWGSVEPNNIQGLSFE